jgi:transposase-like protein
MAKETKVTAAVKEKKRKYYCPHCTSTKPLWKAGSLPRVRKGKVEMQQRFQCKACRRFTTVPRKTPAKS